MEENVTAVQALMDQALREVGFDPSDPVPSLGWEGFKRFVALPLPQNLTTITVGYECIHVSDRDDVLWLEFARQIEDQSGLGWRCGCCFARRVPADLWGVSEGNWWWREDGGFAEWTTEVEGTPLFREILALSGWRWEGFSC